MSPLASITVGPPQTVGLSLITGGTGPTGPTGATGAQGVPGIVAVWRGVWSSGTTYALADGVYRNGLPYISNAGSNLNHDPATDTGTNWGPVVGNLRGWFDVKAFGAVGNGSTDDSTAIQAAINAAQTATGGTVYFPPGTYVAAALSLDIMYGIELRGAGPAMQAQEGISKLLLTAAGSGHLLTMYSSTNCTLRNLTFEYNSASYTGDLIDIDGAPHSSDCQNNLIIDCSTRYGTIGALVAGPARSMIRLNKCVINAIMRCQITGGVNGIRVGDPSGTYVNVQQIEKCCFNEATDAHILIASPDCETLVIRDCTFEAGTNTTGIRGSTAAADGGQNQCYSPVIEGNWFGDSGSAVTWIDSVSVQSNSYTGIIRANRFSTVHSGGTHCRLGGLWFIEGNSFDGGTTAFDGITLALSAHLQLVSICNFYNTITNTFNTTNFPNGAASAGSYSSTNDVGTADGIANRDFTIGCAGKTLITGATGITDTGQGGTTGQGGLVLGAHLTAAYVPLTGTKAAGVYRGIIPSTSRPSINVQAPWGGSNGDGVLLAGATPQPMMQWQDGLLAFFGMVPVNAATLNAHAVTTGYTAGASTAVTIDGKFTGNVGMAAPANFSATAVVGGGTFAAGTYFWKISAVNAAGETVGSTERSATIVLNGSANLAWSRVFGATSYKIYRSTTTGTENVSPALVTTIASGATITYTDTGTATSAGAVLAVSTALTGYTPGDIVAALKNIGAIPG